MASFTLLSITQSLPKVLQERLKDKITLLQQQISTLEEAFQAPGNDREFLERCEDIEEYRAKFLEEKEVTLAWERNSRKWKDRYHYLKAVYLDQQSELEEERTKEAQRPCTCRTCALHKRLNPLGQAQEGCAQCRVRPCHQSLQKKEARARRYREIGKKGGIAKKNRQEGPFVEV